MRPWRTLFTGPGVFVPVFGLETAYTLVSCVVGEFFRADTLSESKIKLVSLGAAETHSGSVIPVMGIVTGYASTVELVRSIVRTNTLFNVWTVNVSIRALGTGVGS